MTDILIKCLRNGGRSVHSFVDAQGYNDWSLPDANRPGAWKGPVKGILRPHHNGLHLAKKDYLIDWLTGHHYLAETTGETAEGLDCVIARQARLTRRLPVNDEKLQMFCNNWLTFVPEMMHALNVYPRISKDVEKCVLIIAETGLENAGKALDKAPEYNYTRLNNMRLGYDALHSIEYNVCTDASKSCLEAIVNVHDMSHKKSSVVEFAKVLSNKVAVGLKGVYNNYCFMKELCDEGYDHKDEVSAMKAFLLEKSFIAPVEDSQSSGHFFRKIRMRQNADILPALGL